MSMKLLVENAHRVLFMISKTGADTGAHKWKNRLVCSYNRMYYDRWQRGWISKTLKKKKKKPDTVIFKIQFNFYKDQKEAKSKYTWQKFKK